MSIFQLPAKVSLTIERKMRSFFWEGNNGGESTHLIRWKTVIKEKVGGLELGAIENQNQVLLAKWGWHFMNEYDALWIKVVISIHGASNYGLFTGGLKSLSFRSPWMGISKVWQQSSPFIKFKLGNGLQISFSTILGLIIWT